MDEVKKANGINVGKKKFGEILGEVNPDARRKKENVVGSLLNPKV